MRGAFVRGPEETLAADSCSQDDCAAPPPALTSAATPEARLWPHRGAARYAQTILPAAAPQGRTKQPWTDRLRRIAGLLRLPRPRTGYRDPLFGRPDLIEDDYYRLRNQPRG